MINPGTSKSVIGSLPPEHRADLADPSEDIVDEGFGHALATLRFAPLIIPSRGRGFASHGRQDVVAGRQANEEGKRDQPDA